MGVGEAKLDIYQPIQFDGIGILPALDTVRFSTTTQIENLMKKLQFWVKDMPLMLGGKQELAVSSVDLNFYWKLGLAINKLSQHLDLEELDSASVTSGLGLVVDYDLFYPTQGIKLRAEYMTHD